MRPLVSVMLAQLIDSAMFARRGSVYAEVWTCHWSFGPRRIVDKVQDRVLTFHTLDIDSNFRRRGFMSELMMAVAEEGHIGGLRYDFVVGENCNDHCLGMFAKAGYEIHDPNWLRIAWRPAQQMRLPLADPAPRQTMPRHTA